MSPKYKIAVSTGVGGWCFVHLENPTFRLYVRVEDFESPAVDPKIRSRSIDVAQILKIVEMHIDGDGYILDAGYLRTIPLAAIEAIINSGENARNVRDDLDAQGYIPLNIARDLSHFESLISNKSTKSKKIDVPILLLDRMRRVSIARPKKLDDEFLVRVADFYRISISLNERPIKMLSESAQVPRDTAARWVKLARARGFLTSTKLGES